MDAATITPASVTLRAAGAGSDVPAAVSYAGGVASLVPNAPLAYNTVYTATVAASVADLAGNQLGTAATWSFTTEPAPLSTLTDTSLADFGAGSVQQHLPGRRVGWRSDPGPHRRRRVRWQQPAGRLGAGPWTVGSGSDHVSGGSLTVNGAYARTTAPTVRAFTRVPAPPSAPPHSRTSGSSRSTSITSRWAVFGIGNAADSCMRGSRVLQAGEVALEPGCSVAAPYRIEWTASAIRFYVDGSFVAHLGDRHHRPAGPIASDFGAGGPRPGHRLVRMSPYPAAGSFTSRVFDAGSNVGWQQLTADELHPVNTSLGFEVRSGNVAVPDASWSSFVPVTGGAFNLTGRYLQYRATLQTTDSGLSPTLRSVTVSYGAAPVDNTRADHHRPHAAQQRHQRHHRLLRQRHLQ